MTIGERLKEARLKKGLSLKEVEAELRIRKVYLEALENDNYSAMPAEAYTRAFLRTYAEYLGLDPVEIMKEYESIHGKPSGSEHSRKELSIPNFILRLLAFAVAASIVVAAIYLALPEKQPKPELPQTPLQTAPEPEETTQSRPATEEPAPAIDEEKPEHFTLRIEVFDAKSWIEIRSLPDNRAIISRTLLKGESFETSSTATLTAVIGYPRAVKIFHNGSEVSGLPKSGVLKIVIDSSGVTLR